MLECKNAHRKAAQGLPECAEGDYRMNPHTWKSLGIMCDECFEEWLAKDTEINERYGVYSSVPPRGYDYLDAGEYWEEDY